MSTTARDGPTRRWGRRFLCIIAGLGGAWCLANTAAMNFAAGKQSASTWLGSIVQPSSSLAIDVMVCVLAAVTFALLSAGSVRSFVSGLLMGVALLGFAGFSVKNTLEFGMQERVERALVTEANEAAKKEAVSLQNQNAIGRQERNLSWLKDQYNKARSTQERRDLRAAIREASKDVIDIKHAEVGHVLGDPGATMLAKRLNWEVEDFLFANQLALAVLLVLGKMLGFGFAVALWPGPERPSVTKAETEALTSANAPADDLSPVADDLEILSSAHLLEDGQLSLDGLEAPEKVLRKQTGRKGIDDLDRARRVRAVRNFISTRMVRSLAPQEGLCAEEVFRAYLTWAGTNAPSCGMTQKVFASICMELGVAKQRCSNVVRYALRPVGEVPALAEVA